MFLFKNIILLFVILNTLSCVEKKSFSGSLKLNSVNFEKISNKSELIDLLGNPNYIDPIDNKYYYFSEKRLEKNFYEKSLESRTILIFKFNKNDIIVSKNQYSLNDEKKLKIIKDTTKDNIIKRGLIEKIFGGVGKQQLPNTL